MCLNTAGRVARSDGESASGPGRRGGAMGGAKKQAQVGDKTDEGDLCCLPSSLYGNIYIYLSIRELHFMKRKLDSAKILARLLYCDCKLGILNC